MGACATCDSECSNDGNITLDQLTRDEQRCSAHADLQLLVGAREGDLTKVSEALRNGAWPEARLPRGLSLGIGGQGARAAAGALPPRRNRDGLTPLMFAVASGSAPCTSALLEARACVHARDTDGMRPLHFAATAADRGVAALLLAARADPDAQDRKGRTASDLLPHYVSDTPAERALWTRLLVRAPEDGLPAGSTGADCRGDATPRHAWGPGPAPVPEVRRPSPALSMRSGAFWPDQPRPVLREEGEEEEACDGHAGSWT